MSVAREPTSPSGGAALDVRTGPKVVLVTDRLPGREIAFQKSGHATYVEGFLRYFLRRQSEIVVVVPRPRVDFLSLRAADLPYRVVSPALRTMRGRIFVADVKPLRATLVWKAYARLPRRLQALAVGARLRVRRLRGYAHQLGSFLSERDRRFVQRAVLAERPEIVLYDGVFNVCGRLLRDAEHWVITHEVKHQRVASFAGQHIAVRPANFDADLEASILGSIGNLIAIHWDDAAEFGRLLPRARTVVVPVSLEIPARDETQERVFGQCIFVGSGSFHNIDGIRWFLDACWPAIRAAIPAATLEVFGSVCQRLDSVPSGVVLRGTVDDLRAAYAQASLALVPLRIGSGLKVKLVEALAHGVPVVTTPVGAQGLLGFRPEPFVAADSADEFARRCIEVLRSPEKRAALARAARACAERFEPDAAFANFDGALRSARAAS